MINKLQTFPFKFSPFIHILKGCKDEEWVGRNKSKLTGAWHRSVTFALLSHFNKVLMKLGKYRKGWHQTSNISRMSLKLYPLLQLLEIVSRKLSSTTVLGFFIFDFVALHKDSYPCHCFLCIQDFPENMIQPKQFKFKNREKIQHFILELLNI